MATHKQANLYPGEVTMSLLRAHQIFERGNYRFASGVESTFKADMDHLPTDSFAFTVICGALVRAVREYEPDAIAAVPWGMTRFGVAVAQRLGVPCVLPVKQPDKSFYLPNGAIVCPPDNIRSIDELENIAVIDDIGSTGISTYRLAQVLGVERVVVGVHGLDRGQDVPGVETLEQAQAYMAEHPDEPPAHIATPYPRVSLATYPIPLVPTPEWIDEFLA
jgi:orotate phosphoribosyltransferase